MRRATPIASVILVMALAAVGCSSDAGAGGSSGVSSGSGGAACNPADCPQPQSECEAATCTLGACDTAPKAGGTPCGAGSSVAKVCGAPGGLAAGACVECNEGADCTSALCVANACTEATCEDHTKNGAETSVDCGGADCPPCANGEACTGAEDCVSKVCKNTACESPCSPPGVVPSAVSGCTNIAAQAALAASGELNPAASAVDQDACTEWNSGGYAPATISFDFGKPRSIGAITLVPNMLPSGDVKHVVETSDDGQTYTPVLAIDQPMVTEVIYPFALPATVSARHVRVRTTASPSWVGWSEVAIFDCP